MPSDNYPYAIGRIKIIENSLLDAQRIARLSELPYAEAVRQLADWGYAADYPVKTDPDALIDFRRKEARALVDEVTPDKELTDLFYLETDATNVKLLLKYRALGGEGLEATPLPDGVFDAETLRECVLSGDYSPLGGVLAERLDKADDAIGEGFNPRTLSAAVDNAFFAHAFEILAAKKNAFCSNYFKTKVDFINVLSVLRARALGWDEEAFAPMIVAGGNISNEALLEAVSANDDKLAELLAVRSRTDLVELDNSDAKVIKSAIELYRAGAFEDARDALADALIKFARDERYDSFGLGPVACFALLSEREAKALRVMFAKKRAGAALRAEA